MIRRFISGLATALFMIALMPLLIVVAFLPEIEAMVAWVRSLRTATSAGCRQRTGN